MCVLPTTPLHMIHRKHQVQGLFSFFELTYPWGTRVPFIGLFLVICGILKLSITFTACCSYLWAYWSYSYAPFCSYVILKVHRSLLPFQWSPCHLKASHSHICTICGHHFEDLSCHLLPFWRSLLHSLLLWKSLGHSQDHCWQIGYSSPYPHWSHRIKDSVSMDFVYTEVY